MTDTMVLIAGAGPTGLTLAVELARAGVPFRLIEAAPGPQPGSRGKGVQPRTLEIFEDLGVADRILANGRLAIPMNSTAPDGTVRHGGTVPPELTGRPDIPYAASLITPEWRVEEALRLRLADLGGTVEFGTSLIGFEQTATSIIARLDMNGIAETVTTRWLVGADGGHSLVRKTLGIPFVGETREDLRMVIADLPLEGLGREAWESWQHPDGIVSLCPLPSTDLFQFQYVPKVAPGEEPPLDLASLQAVVEHRTGRADIRLHEPQWTSVWRANIRLAEHYRAGNAFLAGDAAHIHSPAGGQGMNTGIQDAHNLGWKLTAVANGAAPTLLDSYEAERRPVAEHVLALSNARLAQAIKSGGMPTRRNASTIQLDVGYRGSALARDDRDETTPLHAGDRAPDATGLRTTDGLHRLFELIGGGAFALLSFGEEAPDMTIPAALGVLRILHIVAEPTHPGELADTAGHLANGYGATEATLVLIRPDGYIGLISDTGNTKAVVDYFDRLGACCSIA